MSKSLKYIGATPLYVTGFGSVWPNQVYDLDPTAPEIVKNAAYFVQPPDSPVASSSATTSSGINALSSRPTAAAGYSVGNLVPVETETGLEWWRLGNVADGEEAVDDVRIICTDDATKCWEIRG